MPIRVLEDLFDRVRSHPSSAISIRAQLPDYADPPNWQLSSSHILYDVRAIHSRKINSPNRWVPTKEDLASDLLIGVGYIHYI